MAAGSHFEKKKLAYEMLRNVIENDFLSSKMAGGGHFVTQFIKKKVGYWSEIARNVNESKFSVIHKCRRRPFCEKKINKKVAYWSEMARNVIESDFRSSTKNPKNKLRIEKCCEIK